MRNGKAALMLPLLLGLCASQARAGITITPTYGSSITSDPNAATIENTIQSAINVYEADFSNPITVSIDFNEMSTGLGQSSTYFGSISYDLFRSQLIATKAQGTDNTNFITTNVPAGPDNPVNGSANIDVTTANLKALGFTFAQPPPFDSTIGLNTGITNDSASSTDPSKYSLFAVASHEIDEALGFGSDLNPSPSPTGNIRPLDLFRYSADQVRSYTTSSTATAYLSFNGGQTIAQDQYGNAVYFNQTGGGSDYNDWASASSPRVQDAYGTRGSSPTLGPAELTALQDIGYNSQNPSPAPEPAQAATLALIGLGLGGVILRARKRCAGKAAA